ncbi:hypothetical protein V6N13_065050 [Hibiscus sabdariffa]
MEDKNNFTRIWLVILGYGLCVFTSAGTVALLNPSTRETKTILSYNDHKIKMEFNSRHPFLGGFGYDAFHDDYKVVKIYCHAPTVMEVYSLKNCAWSRIADFPSDGPTRSRRRITRIIGGSTPEWSYPLADCFKTSSVHHCS